MRATGSANHVGRVGALAVALGIGVALFHNTGAAWADDDASSGAQGPTGATSTASGAELREPRNQKRFQESGGTTGSRTGAASTSQTEATVPAEGADGSDVLLPVDEGEELPADEGEELPADETIDIVPEPAKPVVTVPAESRRDGGADRRQQQPVTEPSEVALTPPALGDDSAAPPEISEPPVDLTDAPQPDQPPTVVDDTTVGPPSTPTPPAVEAVTPPAAEEDPAPAPQTKDLVLDLLAGVNPSNSDDGPVGSPLGLALLAAGSRPRQGENAPAGAQWSAAALMSAAASSWDDPAVGVGRNPTGVVISADGTRIYVANTRDNTVSVIDNDSASDTYGQSLRTVGVGSAPGALALSGNRLYVANSGSSTVSVIDTVTLERLDVNPSFFSKDIAVGWAPSALAVSDDGTRLFVANRATSTVSVINLESENPTRIDANPSMFSRDIAVGWSPSALAASADGKYLFVANAASNTVSAISIDTATATYQRLDLNPSFFSKDVAVGLSPGALAVSPDGSRLYVANTASNTVTVIDFDTDVESLEVGETQEIYVGQAPSSLAVSAAGEKVYVALSSDMVAVLDTDTLKVSLAAIDKDAPETGSHTLALGPDGSVYLTDSADGVLRALGQVEGTVTIGRSKLELGTGNGTYVDATWYVPTGSEPPTGLIYLQHGANRTDIRVAALAHQLAEQTNSIVVTPTLSSSSFDRFYMSNEITEQAVAGLFRGDRTALATSADEAGVEWELPQQFVLAGHSLGGSTVSAAAGHLAKANAAGNFGDYADLKAVILFDRNGDDFNAGASMSNLNGAQTVPVRLIASPPCACNTWGVGTMFSLSTQPDDFVAVVVEGGTHLDAEGASSDLLGQVGCWQGTPPPSNVVSVQRLAIDWINDAFTGSQDGVYDPIGSEVGLAGGGKGTVYMSRTPAPVVV